MSEPFIPPLEGVILSPDLTHSHILEASGLIAVEILAHKRPTDKQVSDIAEAIQDREMAVILGPEERVASMAVFSMTKGICKLEDLATERDHRRKGFATRLVGAVEHHALEQGASDVVLYSLYGTEEFYENLGYSPTAEARHYTHKKQL